MSKIKTIHVIDDDEIYAFTVDRVLDRAQIAEKVVYFHDGKQAIDFIKDNAGKPDQLPDLILLDVNMPVMNGWGFLEEYNNLSHQIKKHITIYVVSSSIEEEDFLRARNNPAVTDYLLKPLTMAQIDRVKARLN